MPRELLMQNNYEWGTAEGQTLEIENAIRSNARGLKIEGQTYQNLIDFTTQESTQGITFDQENSVITIIGTPGRVILRLKTFKPNAKYTLITNVLNIPSNPNSPIRINDDGSDYNYNILNCLCVSLGINKVTFTTPSDISNLRLVLCNNDRNVGYKFTFPIIIEGDFTDTDLPTSINGIESVAEKEKEGDLYPVKIAQSNNETDGIILPNGVKNTIEMVNGVLTHVQRVWKYTANDTRFITSEELIHKTSVMFKIYPKKDYSWLKPKNYNDTKSNPICSLFNYIPSEKTADELYVSESDDACFYTGGSDWLRVKLTKATYGKIISLTEFLEMKPIIYYELVTPITEPLTLTEIPLPQPLRSLPNGVCDTIEGNKLIQRVGKYTITGNETYDLRFKNDYMFVVQFDNILTETAFDDYNNSNTKMICDKALCGDCSNSTFVSNSLTIGGRRTNSKGFMIAIPKSLLSEYTIDKAKEYIQSLGGMTVYYELATPIEHTINVPRVSIAKGSNIITTTNNIKPNLSIKYKKLKKNKR